MSTDAGQDTSPPLSTWYLSMGRGGGGTTGGESDSAADKTGRAERRREHRAGTIKAVKVITVDGDGTLVRIIV